MTITLNRDPNGRYLELGGGSNPQVHPKCLGGNDVAVDVRVCHLPDGRQCTDFTADFNEPLPIRDAEFDGVFSQFCIEHLSWRKVRQFLSECCRVLKPGGKAAFVTADVESQMKWLREHPDGWDGKDAFDSCSELIYGSQDYEANTHRNYMAPAILVGLIRAAGFSQVTTQPYGERSTDLLAVAVKGSGQAPRVKEIEMNNYPEPIRDGAMFSGKDVGAMEALGLHQCNAIGPNGATCGLPKGHAGNHKAEMV